MRIWRAVRNRSEVGGGFVNGCRLRRVIVGGRGGLNEQTEDLKPCESTLHNY